LIFSVLVISNVVNTALYPSLSRQSVTLPHTLPAIQERMLRYLLIIALPIAVGGSLLAAQLVNFLYGVDYAAAALPLAILIWVVPLMFVTEFLGYVIVVDGAERRVAWAIGISTTFNVALNFALIPVFGLLAASILTVVTEAILLSQYAWLLRDKLRHVDWGLTLWRPLLALLVMAGVVFALRDFFLPVTILAGAAVYLLLLLLLGVIGKAEFSLLTGFRHQAGHSQG
jgi:O-antigen/teichoic acid export membrane protein